MPAFLATDGLPLWNEIAVSDLDKAQHFYAEVFGWDFMTPTDDPDYLFARKEGLPVASLIKVDKVGGLVTYFSSPTVDADTTKATELGATIISEPADFLRGRASILSDPSGALFGLMDARDSENFVAAGEPGTPVWYELYARSTVSDFYAELLGWSIESSTEGYTVAVSEGAAFAGILDAPAVPASVWFPYIGVERVDASLNAATLAGGQIVREPEMTEFGIIAAIADPDGTVIIICEVQPWEEEEDHEGDSVLHL